MQPPSGGCVLKHDTRREALTRLAAATFGWLCVETIKSQTTLAGKQKQPPSGGCVLKPLCI